MYMSICESILIITFYQFTGCYEAEYIRSTYYLFRLDIVWYHHCVLYVILKCILFSGTMAVSVRTNSDACLLFTPIHACFECISLWVEEV